MAPPRNTVAPPASGLRACRKGDAFRRLHTRTSQAVTRPRDTRIVWLEVQLSTGKLSCGVHGCVLGCSQTPSCCVLLSTLHDPQERPCMVTAEFYGFAIYGYNHGGFWVTGTIFSKPQRTRVGFARPSM